MWIIRGVKSKLHEMLFENNDQDIADTFVYELKVMNLVGMYKDENIKVHPLWYYSLGVFYLGFALIQYFSLILQMILDRGQTDSLLDTLYFFNAQNAFLCKLFPFLWRRKMLTAFIAKLRNPLFTRIRGQAQHDIVKGELRWYKKFSLVFRIICYMTATFYALAPVIDNQPLAVPAWYPFDVMKYRNVVYTIQTCAFYITGYGTCTLDFVSTSLISMGRTQFALLKNNLSTCTTMSDKEMRQLSVEQRDELVIQRLRYCIIKHQFLLGYVQDVENVLALGIFLQFCNSIMTFCMTGVKFVTTPPNSMGFLTVAMFFVCMLVQIAMYSWFGHGIMEESDGVVEACYMSEWNHFSSRVRKVLFIIMERGKRPSFLTAGKILILNLATYLTIMKTSYSYFAVLRRVYSDD